MRSDAFTFDKKFLAKIIKQRITINPGTGCWEWTDFKSRGINRYPLIKIQGEKFGVHRLCAYVWLNFDLRSKLLVRHFICSNPICCYYKHLRPGTHHDNSMDSVRNGKYPANRTKGSIRYKAILHEDDIPVIRELLKRGATMSVIAEHYGISISAISSIKQNRSWMHVSLDTKPKDMEKHEHVKGNKRRGLKGSENHKAKLTESDVKEIKKLFKERKLERLEIAKRYGVKLGTIKGIKSGKTWKHVQ